MISMPAEPHICIAPIFLCPEESFWRDEDQGTLLLEILHAMKAWSCLDALRVFTDDLSIARQLRCVDIAVDVIPADTDDRYLPRGTTASLEAAASDDKNALFIIRDFRQPDVTGHELVRLMASWQAMPEMALAAVSVPKDHPCQFFQGFRVSGGGYVHYQDTASRARYTGFWISRPCRMPSGRIPREHLLTHFWDAAASDAHAAEPILPDAARSGNKPVLHFLADGMARVLFPVSMLGPGHATVAGLSLLKSANPAQIHIRRNGEHVLRVDTSPSPEEADHLLICFYDGETWKERIQPSGIDISIGRHLHGEGLFYFTLQATRDGGCDFSIPFKDPFNGWQVAENILLNDETGRVIHGRQCFPDRYLLDVALAMGRYESLINFDDALLKGRIRGAPASWPAEKIINRIDHLYYRLRSRSDTAAIREDGNCNDATAIC